MLDFSKPMTALNGEALKDENGYDITLAKVLSAQLASTNKGDALKFFTWATKLYNGKPLDLDPSDSSTLKEFIKNNETMTVLAKAQLLNVFE